MVAQNGGWWNDLQNFLHSPAFAVCGILLLLFILLIVAYLWQRNLPKEPFVSRFAVRGPTEEAIIRPPSDNVRDRPHILKGSYDEAEPRREDPENEQK